MTHQEYDTCSIKVSSLHAFFICDRCITRCLYRHRFYFFPFSVTTSLVHLVLISFEFFIGKCTCSFTDLNDRKQGSYLRISSLFSKIGQKVLFKTHRHEELRHGVIHGSIDHNRSLPFSIPIMEVSPRRPRLHNAPLHYVYPKVSSEIQVKGSTPTCHKSVKAVHEMSEGQSKKPKEYIIIDSSVSF